jgi:glycosyltransferase involved in cell wall biosynthesis
VLRVLFVHDHLGYPGGAIHGVTTYFQSVLPGFHGTQVEGILCINRNRHPAADLLEAAGVRVIFLKRGKWDPRVLWELIRVIRKERIDLLHLAGRKAMLFGRIAGRLTGRPAIIHLHDADPAWPRFLQRQLARWTQCALTVCEPLSRVAVRDYRMVPEKVQVLHNCIATEQFDRLDSNARHQARIKLNLAGDVPVIGVFGRIFFAEKGQDVLLRALPNILACSPDTKLLIVGEGPDRLECERLCGVLDLGDAVRFTGQRNDVAALMAAVDVVVVPSVCEEASPYVVLEALCAGRAVVASNVGGMGEIVVEGKTGLLVPKGNETALADALVLLLKDRTLRDRLGECGRLHAQNFTVERHVQRLTEIYRVVAGSERSGMQARSLVAPNARPSVSQ